MKHSRSRLAPPLGFTLAELIVVITILAILATVGILTLSDYLSSSRDSSRITEIGQISRSVELSAVQNGKYPMPVASETSPLVSFTGWAAWSVIVTQWAATSVNVRDLGGSFGKKKATGPFAYSVLGDGVAYQVASEFENAVGFSAGFAEPAYAASKTAYVAGTYRPDPSLPSLVTSSGSVGPSGIFSPDACFVTHGWPNLFSSNSGCVPKKSLGLKSVDQSLVAYWDMETVCAAWSCWTWNDGKLADLSGNGNHGTSNGAVMAGWTGWLVGKATELDGVNDYFQIANAPVLNFSGSFTISAIYTYSKSYSGMGNNPIIQKPFSSHVAPYYQYHLWVASPAYLSSGKCGFSLSATVAPSTYKYLWSTSPCGGFLGQNYVTSIRYDWTKISVWINGVKTAEETAALNLTDATKDVFIWAQGNLLASPSAYLAWTVDEIRIFSRALSDDQLSQQARVAGLQ